MAARKDYVYFCDDWLIYRQERRTLEDGQSLDPRAHQELLNTELWPAWADLEDDERDADDATERFMLPLVLDNPAKYEAAWEHVEADVCPGCRPLPEPTGLIACSDAALTAAYYSISNKAEPDALGAVAWASIGILCELRAQRENPEQQRLAEEELVLQ